MAEGLILHNAFRHRWLENNNTGNNAECVQTWTPMTSSMYNSFSHRWHSTIKYDKKKIAYCVQNLTRKVQVDCFLISVLFNRKKESSLEKKERKNTKHDNNVISVSLSEQTAFHDDRGR